MAAEPKYGYKWLNRLMDHRAMMPMYFKKVLLLLQEQFECDDQNAPAPPEYVTDYKRELCHFRMCR